MYSNIISQQLIQLTNMHPEQLNKIIQDRENKILPKIPDPQYLRKYKKAKKLIPNMLPIHALYTRIVVFRQII